MGEEGGHRHPDDAGPNHRDLADLPGGDALGVEREGHGGLKERGKEKSGKESS
jgi:hypothetical protein